MENERKKPEKEYTTDNTAPASDAVKKRQRQYAFSSSGHWYRAHTYCVFNDPDFQNEITTLRRKFEKIYYPKVSLSTSEYDKHLLTKDKKFLKETAEKYFINLDDLAFYADGYFNAGYTGFGKISSLDGGFKYFQPGEDDERPVYVIGLYTTLEDIRSEWGYIEEMRKLSYLRNGDKVTRRRAPENPKLLYAVFKARMKGQTYRQIFDSYSTGKLELYDGNSSQFSNEESLERYYRKYIPKQQGNIVDPLL